MPYSFLFIHTLYHIIYYNNFNKIVRFFFIRRYVYVIQYNQHEKMRKITYLQPERLSPVLEALR